MKSNWRKYYKFERVCLLCKKSFKTKYRKDPNKVAKFCSRKCQYQTRSKFSPIKLYGTGKKHPFWKGGRFINPSGYVQVTVPDRPKMVLEHRYKMEKKLGRRLDTLEHVHHRNGKKADNRLSNLMVVAHARHHSKVKCPKCAYIFGVH